MFYWKVQWNAVAFLFNFSKVETDKNITPSSYWWHYSAPAAPHLLFPLFTGTHFRSSSAAISCLTWWNSLAILQCSLYTWTLSVSDTQGATGCSREEQRISAWYKIQKCIIIKNNNKENRWSHAAVICVKLNLRTASVSAEIAATLIHQTAQLGVGRYNLSPH